MAFGELVNVHLRHFREGDIQLPCQGGTIPEDIAQFVEDLGFTVIGDAAGVVSEDFFQLVGDLARLARKAKPHIP